MNDDICPLELMDTPNEPFLWALVAKNVFAGNKQRPAAWAEFGVAGGQSATYFLTAATPFTTFHLFDSYLGLPEEWDFNGDINHIGRYAQPHPPRIEDSRVVWHNGMFADTLPVADMGTLDFVHIDCDIYSSTKTVFDHIQVREGTLILFDEYWGYLDYRNHERKAFLEWSERTGYELEWMGKNRSQAAGIIRSSR